MRNNGWRRLSERERCVASEYIHTLSEDTPEERRDKKILSYFVIDNLSASAISRMNDPDIICFGNRAKGKPLSNNYILQIIYKHFPQFHGRQSSTSNTKRIELIRIRQKTKSKHIARCAFCGAKDNLEEHHMIPLFMGGTNDERNLVFLCHECHLETTAYQRAFLQKRGAYA